MHTKEEILKAIGQLMDVQDRLRKECPWDRKQTFDSLRPYTIEEVYELCDAIMHHDSKNICKELGDVMEHIVFYALLGREEGTFDLADVCNAQSDKLMYRHDFIDWNQPRPALQEGTSSTIPLSAIWDAHWTVTNPAMTIDSNGKVVYKDDQQADSAKAAPSKPSTATQVEASWEQRKQHEADGNATVLSGVPSSLPSLIKAYRVQDKARNVGFDWKKKEEVWSKVREELQELETELGKEDKARSTEELGDFLFSVINAARLYHLNPDNALETTNQKFIRRFTHVEKRLKELGKSFKDSTLEEMDKYWDEAKKLEKEGQKD